MINLYEYQNKAQVHDFSELEIFLDEIWAKREKYAWYREGVGNNIESQRFLQFLHKTSEIKSNKYVGVIHFNGNTINLLPKIFYDPKSENGDYYVRNINSHILWWLSYCRKIKFPNYQTTLNTHQSNFFEVLIYLFSSYTRSLLNSTIYQRYEEINNETVYLKGRINTSDYINQNLATGNWNKLNCCYDSFVIDNEFNRIIKFVSTLLFHTTTSIENKNNLREILFILDEVTDQPARAEQCSRITFNPMFSIFETVRDYCYLFLSNSISFSFKNELKVFAFLLPMEYMFEDFIFGFIHKEISKVKAIPQTTSMFLDESAIFQLKPDLLMETSSRKFIADTKYKIVLRTEDSNKKGISEKDLYQLIIYAIRFGIRHVFLLYPETITSEGEETADFTIKDMLANNSSANDDLETDFEIPAEIEIKACQLPIIDKSVLQSNETELQSLNELFEDAKVKLKERIEELLIHNY